MEQHTLKIGMPTSLQVERWAPFGLATVAVAAWLWLDGAIAASFAKELLGALISAASVAVGFLTTALSILLPVANSPTGLKLRRSGYSQDLFRYMRSGIYGCIGLAVVSVVAFFTLTDSGPNPYLSGALIWFAAYSAAALLRVAEILMALFERVSEPEDKGG